MSASAESGTRLVAVDELPGSRVTVVEGTPHGTLAVGISGGQPFAVSNRCRHLFASLGQGDVTEEGFLQCPWHGARFNLRTGEATTGPAYVDVGCYPVRVVGDDVEVEV